MLQGHIYQTMMANIGLHCLSVCLKDDRCQSFNFVMSLHMCEFSDRTKEARPEDFIPDADRYYFRKYINRVPLGSISDLAATSCKEIKMSEGRSPNGKYWMSSIKPGIPVLAFCDMKTEDVNECTASSPVCHVNATCNNTLGSYRCTCKPGYAGDGKTCKDFDECSASLSVCHVNALCSNIFGSYHCACKLGYAGDGKTCKDLNECNSSPTPCHSKAKCTNNEGSYLCSCDAGYTGDGKTCTDLNECNSSPTPCHAKAKCKNNQGSYLCSCDAGYTGDGKTCTDLNECNSSPTPCHAKAKCKNNQGSYLCSCDAGYTGDGKTCTDINECTSFQAVCSVNALCSNNLGSYSCSCKPGYSGNGKICTVSGPLPSSNILGNLDGKYLVKLDSFLVPVLQSSSRSRFLKCWRAKTDGWAASTFHSNCDGKGPTVTIIKVGSYIFGGYTDLSWYSSSCVYSSSSKSFIYSLYNINGFAPVKRQVKSGRQGGAIYRCSRYGPTFGNGHDIYISNNATSNRASYTYCGSSYPLPPGYSSSGSSCRFYAGSYTFTPTDIEVFYETTT
ncbi:fibrillin-2-like isoform X1 [Montipora capricornis]|uniref:fibrillin-2-like isoform X1 n=1 Tax=Montipora capricornis TaxID=246305 RepID=UPI0035F1E680